MSHALGRNGHCGRRSDNPREAAITTATLTVQHSLPELGVTYADDNETWTRYFIDAQSRVAFDLKPGQQISAVVNDKGYVISAELLAD